MPSKPSAKSPNFEKSLEQLESLVAKMESGELSLEESLKAFEEGVKLSRDCQTRLTEAEQRVQILIDQQAVDFDEDDDDEDVD